MSKRGAMFPTALWSDKPFTKLSPAEQLLFVRLWTSPDLSSCGHHVLQMSLWGRGFTPQATESDMREVVGGLEANDWIAADFDTEEVFLVPFIRLDAAKQPQIYASACRTIQAVRSSVLRQRAWQQVQKTGRAENPTVAESDSRQT